MQRLPAPSELGLPEKFDGWRGNQEHGVDSIRHSPKRHTVFSAPTGYGKTLVYMVAAILSSKRTCILTHTKGLQDQLMGDFESCGLVDLRGRANYNCDMHPEYSCEEGRAARCPYWGTMQCSYSRAEMKASSSNLVVMNYAKWLSSGKIDPPYCGFQQLICDEGHLSLDALSDAMQVVLHHREIETDLGIDFLTGGEAEDFWYWKRWARNAVMVCAEKVKEAGRKLEVSNPKVTWVKHYNHMLHLQNQLDLIQNANTKDWVAEEIEEGWQFDPIRPARYSELKMLARIPRVVWVSATIRPKTMHMHGISDERFDFMEYPSDFDASRCPTYWIPTMRNDHRQDDFSQLYLKSDQIMARRGDRKGIIHTGSWKRLQELLDRSRYGSRLMYNIKGQPITESIQVFRKSSPPTVFASPSIGTGFDFPGTDCEYQIILKIPFQDGRSKVIKARQEQDKDYGPYRAMQALVQAVGRIMRSKGDRGVSFILDDHVEWFVPRYSHFAPRTFHQFYKQADIIPPPPPKLGMENL